MIRADEVVTKHHRGPLHGLMVANAISMIGNNLGTVAIPWFVLETTGSAAKTGITGFAAILPTVLSAILGGALVDRLGKKRISIVADLISCFAVALIPLLYNTVGIAFWQLVALVFLSAMLDAPGNTARMAVVPDVAAMAGVPIERANGIAQAIQSGSVLAGPPLAGLAIAWLGASNVLWLNAGSFLVSAAIIWKVFPPVEAVAETTGRYLDEVREGLRFIGGSRFLVALLSIGAIANFAGAPLFAVILPVYAREVYGEPTDLGWLLGGIGAGSLLGAVAFSTWGARIPKRRVAIGLSFLSAAPVAFLALDPPLWLALVTMAISGFGDGAVNPLIITAIYERVPEAMRGRVIGSMIALILAAAPLGMVIAGVAIGTLSVDAVLLGVACLLLTVTVLISILPAFRELDWPAPEETTNA